MEATIDQVAAAVSVLDGLLMLRDPDNRSLGTAAEDERHFSNLAFFDLFSSLENPAVMFQRRLLDAHILQLGTGGVGLNVLQSLAGLGVGRLTLLDCDVIEPRNFARQFAYRQRDIGRSKVFRAGEWVTEFDPGIEVDVVERRVGGVRDVTDLLDGVDLVILGIDKPKGVEEWVNEACMSAGVPLVRGGMQAGRLRYVSVWPGRSPCLACRAASVREAKSVPGVDGAEARLLDRIPSINRGIGPAAALIGAWVSLEALRYLTGYEPPRAAGADVVVDLTDGGRETRMPWQPEQDCALCAAARERLAVTQVGT